MTKVFRNVEFWVGAVMIGLSLFVFWQMTRIKVMDSRLFPGITGFIMGVSGALQVAHAIQGKSTALFGQTKIRPFEWLLFVILVCMQPLYETLGFYATLFVLAFCSSVMVFKPKAGKDWRMIVIYDISLMAVTYACFGLFLGLVTPEGLFL